MVAPVDDVPPNIESAMVFAESLGRSYAAGGGDVVHLFAAFVGAVIASDAEVGLKCLKATDSLLSKISSFGLGASPSV